MKARILSLVVVSLFLSTVAFAQATRTWVSGVGNDANPCSRTAPCKTFAGAISKTATSGQISVLDPGGFGALTITKSITIDGAGELASVLFSLTNGIVINAEGSSKVILRNLQFEGAGSGLNAVSIVGAGTVVMENITMSGAQKGVSVTNVINTVKLYMTNVDIAGMSQNGVSLAPTSAGGVNAMLDGVRISNIGTTVSHDGIAQGANASTHLRNVTVFSAAGCGLHLNGTGALSTVENSSFIRNGTHGVHADATGSAIRIANSSSLQNGLSGYKATLGTLFSYHNNQSSDNGAVDSPNTPQAVY